MNTVTVNQATLIVEPMGLDKLWSFKRCLEIPLAHVRGATFDPGINDEPKGIRWPGLSIPGKWIGTFRQKKENSFWNVSTSGATVVIELDREDFTRLILTVDDPNGIVESINAAIQ